jgi:hypothetical protein
MFYLCYLCLFVYSGVRWSLSPVVCRRAHVLFMLFVFVCVKWCPPILCCVFVLFFFVLSVSLECQFFIAPSEFSNVYLH